MYNAREGRKAARTRGPPPLLVAGATRQRCPSNSIPGPGRARSRPCRGDCCMWNPSYERLDAIHHLVIVQIDFLLLRTIVKLYFRIALLLNLILLCQEWNIFQNVYTIVAEVVFRILHCCLILFSFPYVNNGLFKMFFYSIVRESLCIGIQHRNFNLGMDKIC
jgi:hypothetical protein